MASAAGSAGDFSSLALAGLGGILPLGGRLLDPRPLAGPPPTIYGAGARPLFFYSGATIFKLALPPSLPLTLSLSLALSLSLPRSHPRSLPSFSLLTFFTQTM
jgi:hypothetical protein